MSKHKNRKKLLCSSCGKELLWSRYCDACGVVTPKADEVLVDGVLYAVNDRGGMTAADDYFYQLKMADDIDIVIPDEIYGRPVDKIKMGLGWHRPFHSVMFPDTVKRIGKRCFYDSECVNKDSVRLPAYLEELGDNAFMQCGGLDELILPDTLTRVGRGLCAYCYKLRKVKLPKNVEYIGCNAFDHCFRLKDITIPETVKFIGKFAFFMCSSLETISIPDGVEFIADGAFSACSSLRKITLGKGLKQIGRAFWKCESLRRLDIPDSVERITYDAFKFCDDLIVSYRGKTYNKDTFNEIYDDTPPLKYYMDWDFKYKYPLYEYAIPYKSINDDLMPVYHADEFADPKQLAYLPIRRSVTHDSLPESFDKFYLPEGLYSEDDTIETITRIGEHFENSTDTPYGMNEKWNGVKGRMKAAVISKQAILLKKYFNLEVNFSYNRFGKLGGFTVTYHNGFGNKQKCFEFNPKDSPRRQLGYTRVKIANVPEFIREMNKMIDEYLIWCYERRIDPCFYSIIPLGNGKNISFGDKCRTDLWKLVVTNRMRDKEE